ncbi:MAG TPA: lytic murein transglycosylase, partial [Alphaproteobacteria bacterium]|nr:lytic murein transglycosylase [Alphaproteobacteria bacterium]
MTRLLWLFAALLLATPASAQTPPPVEQFNYNGRDFYAQPQISFEEWLSQLGEEALAKGIRLQTVTEALQNLSLDESVLEKDRTQPENTVTAQQYWDRLLSKSRISKGEDFFDDNKALLRKVGAAYGVRPRYIVALLGIESNYGDGQGRESIINSLATLAYDGRRADYFRGELLNALRILDQNNMTSDQMKGSWAGAMGYCQFMPSSFLKFARDFDGDGRIDIWTSVADAAASAANYLHESGWHADEPWGEEVDVPDDLPSDVTGTKIQKSLAEWRELGIRRKSGQKLPASLQASLIQPDGPEGRSFLVYNNFRV